MAIAPILPAEPVHWLLFSVLSRLLLLMALIESPLVVKIQIAYQLGEADFHII